MTADPQTGRSLDILLLGLALVLASGTQLRFYGPIGPGEGLLIAWAVAVVWKDRKDPEKGRWARPLLIFIVAIAVLMSMGTVVAASSGLVASDAGRNALALAFSWSLVAVVAFSRIRFEKLARILLPASALLLAGIYALALAGIDFMIFEPWWPTGGRFRGWAVNPNQLALNLVILPFLGIFLLQRRSDSSVLSAAMASTWLCLMTGSKAALVAWAVGLCGLWVAVRWKRVRMTRQAGALLAFMIGSSLLTLTLIWPRQLELRAYFGTHLGWAYPEEELTGQRVRKANQLRNRLLLAGNGVRATAASPLVGLGPGSHSGMAGPHLRGESHITLVELAASTGVLGVLAALGLTGVVTRRLWTAQPILMPALLVLLTFSCFHNVLRQPFTWLLLLWFLAVAGPHGGSRRDDARNAPAWNLKLGTFNRRSSPPSGGLFHTLGGSERSMPDC